MRYAGRHRTHRRASRIALTLAASAALTAVLGPSAPRVGPEPPRPAERHTAAPRPDTLPAPFPSPIRSHQ